MCVVMHAVSHCLKEDCRVIEIAAVSGFRYWAPVATRLTLDSLSMQNKWLSQINAEKRTKVEIFEHASLLTLDNILQCLMSYKSDCQLHA